MGIFDVKSSIPKDDRIQHYDGLWQAEPRKKTMIGCSDRPSENYQFTISKTQEQLNCDPDEEIKDQITNFGLWLVVVSTGLIMAGFTYDAFWRWELNQEMNKKQRQSAKNV